MTKRTARRFMLLKQGLLGAPRFAGKEGILAYVREAGCIQFDPVDVCGMNVDLVLQSRVDGYNKTMLQELLYQNRKLYDHYDKMMSILAIEDWPYFARTRHNLRQWTRVADALMNRSPAIMEQLETTDFVNSKVLDLGKMDWYWSSTSVARATLEAMFFVGELMIHHKDRTIRHYAPTARLLPPELLAAPDPYPVDADHHAWRVWRRIGAVGLLWNRRSDAFLGTEGLSAADRDAAFQTLIKAGRIVAAEVEGFNEPLYLRTEDLPFVVAAESEQHYPLRATLLAPLDGMLWDRKLIAKLFDFDYTWEIYTPADKLKYAHYTLPIICGERFIGRTELRTLKKEGVLAVRHVWLEDGVKPSAAIAKALERCFQKFADFSELSIVRGEEI
ncbi:MAG: crosslink repair DNA glycosylase YcaQ family protein [bacterium]